MLRTKDLARAHHPPRRGARSRPHAARHARRVAARELPPARDHSARLLWGVFDRPALLAELRAMARAPSAMQAPTPPRARLAAQRAGTRSRERRIVRSLIWRLTTCAISFAVQKLADRHPWSAVEWRARALEVLDEDECPARPALEEGFWVPPPTNLVYCCIDRSTIMMLLSYHSHPT
jgi:hypothetical protein